MTRNEEIVELFKQGKKQIYIASIFNLSRERVRQIVSRYAPQDYIDRRIEIHQNSLCEQCGKDRRVKRKSGINICLSCYHTLYPEYNWSKKYPFCIECGKNDLEHKGGGRCITCYSMHKYNTDEQRRIKANYYTRRWEKNNRDKVKEIVKRAVIKYRAKQKLMMAADPDYARMIRDKRNKIALQNCGIY